MAHIVSISTISANKKGPLDTGLIVLSGNSPGLSYDLEILTGLECVQDLTEFAFHANVIDALYVVG